MTTITQTESGITSVTVDVSRGLTGATGNDATVTTEACRAAGSLIDDEVTNLDAVKSFDPTDYATAAQGALADSAVQPGQLATVASSGEYNDLSNLPTLGSAAATESTDYATAAQGATADSAAQKSANLSDLVSASSARTNLGLGSAATLTASTSGGASTIAQYNASGNLYTGPTYTGTTAFDSNGNIVIPDLHGLRWLKRDGTVSGFDIYAWEQHDANGGEFIFDSPWRMAFICTGPIQIGSNASGRDAQCFHIVSGTSTAADPIKPSKAISWQTKRYNGGSETVGYVTAQATSLSSTTNETVLQFSIAENPASGPVDGFNGGGGTYTKGNPTGTLTAELSSAGWWTPGTAPAYVTLTDAATITITCSKYKTVQSSRVTLGGNRTLVFSGALAGMRGIIYVTQDATGSRTLTPSGGSALPLSTTAGYVDRVTWDYDGTYFNFAVQTNIVQNVVLSDSDAAAFVAAASITNAAQKAALDTLVQSLKSASLWTRWHALYPFVGGTSTAHAVNLKSPGTYNITWSGSPTHNSNGVTGDGTAAYGNTNLNPSSVMSVNSSSVYTYCRTQTPTASSYFCGSTTATTRLGYAVSSGNLAGHGPNDNNGGVLVVSAGSDFRKHFAIDRSGASAVSIFANSTKVAGTTASVSAPNGNFFVLARNASGAPNGYTNANIAFQALGGSLSDSEWTTFRGIIDTFQTALGRANS